MHTQTERKKHTVACLAEEISLGMILAGGFVSWLFGPGKHRRIRICERRENSARDVSRIFRVHTSFSEVTRGTRRTCRMGTFRSMPPAGAGCTDYRNGPGGSDVVSRTQFLMALCLELLRNFWARVSR